MSVAMSECVAALTRSIPDFEDFFQGSGAGSGSQKPASAQPKAEPARAKAEETPRAEPKAELSISDDEDILPPERGPATKPKPKRGRLISNETPLADFNRLVEGEGDVFRKAIQDLGAVVLENVAASFSYQWFAQGLECLAEMRTVALGFEEVETYNE